MPGSSLAESVRSAYSFTGPALELGALMLDAGTPTDVPVRIPLGMLNRHGLVAGATGTGKTKTLQLMAEQLSSQGVPVFAADVKGDLTGLACPGAEDPRTAERAASVGQHWEAQGFPVELFALGGEGVGVPLRATVSSFGPVLLAKVLGLNETQESSLQLVFHYADTQGLPLLDLADLRAVVQHLVSEEGKPELKALGGLSAATAGVILRELVAFAAQGADAFFGEPELETADLLGVDEQGRGIISLVELPRLQDRPEVFSTFLMWLLADLFHDLPEVGDPEKPRLAFFFDEAHLLFTDASKEFLEAITRTVRLIRSKGVAVFFVTQSPTDVPDEVLAQLGSRVQHQLRAHTPRDARALDATVDTYPHSGYDDLGKVITGLGTGEAVVTVLDERGAPTPVAWTRLRAPASLMAPADQEVVDSIVSRSPLHRRYAEPLDRESARELLARRLEEGAAKAKAEEQAAERARREPRRDRVGYPEGRRERKDPSGAGDMVSDVLGSPEAKRLMRTAAREIARGLFRVGRR
jgi:DNA helicase HerA-like ATPase